MKLFSAAVISTLIIFHKAHGTTAVSGEKLVVRVLSDRTESHLRPLFEAFEKSKNIKVEAVFVADGLVNRLESRPTEADVVITKDAELMEVARYKGLLQPYSSELIRTAIPIDFRDQNGTYFVDAYRARVIFYSKARVKAEQLSTYEDLASPKWAGKFCIRSGYQEYNLSLFGQMLVSYGNEKTKFILKGLHVNLAREPRGSDRDQAKAIFEGKCDVALMNTYYHAIMETIPDQKPWADATDVFYPNQKTDGSFIMRSALGLTKAKTNLPQAHALLEFFASAEGQELQSRNTFQFPTNKSVQLQPALRKLAASQGDVKDGKFKMNFIPLDQVASKRETVLKFLDEVGFDKK